MLCNKATRHEGEQESKSDEDTTQDTAPVLERIEQLNPNLLNRAKLILAIWQTLRARKIFTSIDHINEYMGPQQDTRVNVANVDWTSKTDSLIEAIKIINLDNLAPLHDSSFANHSNNAEVVNAAGAIAIAQKLPDRPRNILANILSNASPFNGQELPIIAAYRLLTKIYNKALHQRQAELADIPHTTGRTTEQLATQRPTARSPEPQDSEATSELEHKEELPDIDELPTTTPPPKNAVLPAGMTHTRRYAESNTTRIVPSM
jgi:hypothetical protein